MENQIEITQPDERKIYVKPVILHELGLAARACDPGSLRPPLDDQEQ